jgi:transcriptional regulator NrdR family protein
MVAYLRFASVFHRYTDAEQFRLEVLRLTERPTGISRESGIKTVS